MGVVTVSGEMFQNLDASTLQEGDRLTLDQEVRLRMDTRSQRMSFLLQQ